ncbi:MAG TPA: hypothetical protein VHV08_16730, partial [Pirellulales bacterium]|nr:hypothetical protein [Pirellulales bacterium]
QTQTMSEKQSQQQAPGCVLLSLRMLGWSVLGFVAGAVVGLFLIPTIGSLVLSRDYEIRPWDGQFIGETVGALVGIMIFLKRNRRPPHR